MLSLRAYGGFGVSSKPSLFQTNISSFERP
jgi:hypothetical protein